MKSDISVINGLLRRSFITEVTASAQERQAHYILYIFLHEAPGYIPAVYPAVQWAVCAETWRISNRLFVCVRSGFCN